MVSEYVGLKLPKLMNLPRSVPCAEIVKKSSRNVTLLTLVLSRELFAKICRAETAGSKSVKLWRSPVMQKGNISK